MSDISKNEAFEKKAAEPTVVSAPLSDEPLKAVIPSGTVLSGTTIQNQPWFSVFLPQTFLGAVVSGSATPTLSGGGYAGQNIAGLVYQNDQYNTTVRGF